MEILLTSWNYVTGGQKRNDTFVDLVCRYSDSVRKHHDLEHIREMLQGLLAMEQRACADLHRAVWWHDAIYDSTRKDNEERSADLAAQTLASWGVPEAEIQRVQNLILVTKHHDAPHGDRDAATLIDLDLSILAAIPEKYDLYAVNIREEYGWVDAEAYIQGRSDFLRGMLARPQIFTTLPPDAEAQARSNMARELNRLNPRLSSA